VTRSGFLRRAGGIVVAALAAGLAGCAGTPAADSSARIWDSARGAFVSERELDARLAGARVVLLGETHDNAEHHALQYRVLRKIVASGARPALVMEQFDTAHQEALAKAQHDAELGALHRGSPSDPDALATAGRLDRRGWEWGFYRPLVATALEFRLPLIAGNLSRDDARRVMQQGFAALDGARALGLPPAFSTEQSAAITRDIVDGHCGMLPAERAQPMVAAQQARDAVMADAIVRNAARGAVLIAGAGHVRRDVGVPVYLGARGVPSLAIGFVEAPASVEGAEAAKLAAAAGRRFDYVWLTSTTPRGDPCAAFRKPPTPGTPAPRG
jgi:uncharacterized iron-regulated protein